MCYNCWLEAGSPSFITKNVLDTIPLIERVYDFSAVGGACHIVIDDWNCEDDNIAFTIQYLENQKDSMDEDEYNANVLCISALETLTTDERYTALAIYEGILEKP